MPYSMRYDNLLRLGWIPPIELVSGNLRDIEIRDVRRGGSVYRVAIDNCDDCTNGEYFPSSATAGQSFYVGYHGGVDEDAWQNAQGTSTYGGSGLLIWHVPDQFSDTGPEDELSSNARTRQTWDLEVASGRYEPIPDPNNPGTYLGLDNSTPNPTDGLDRFDTLIPYHLQEALYTRGSAAGDFFNPSGVREFSYRSNPNTFGYSPSCTSVPLASRLSSFDANEDVPNSVFIEIKEEGWTTDGEYDGPYAIVDILLAPHEDVTYPNAAHDRLTVGQPMTFTWTMDRSFGWDGVLPYDPDNDLVIETVDIYVDPTGGESLQPWSLVASGVPNTGSFTWTPTTEFISQNARATIVYHNKYSTHLASDSSDETFVVGNPPVATLENKSVETQLAYDGQPYSSVALDFDGDALRDLMIAIQDQPSKLFRNLGVAGGVPSFAEWPASRFEGGAAAPQAGLHGLAVADYDNDGDDDFFASANINARLYKNDGAGNFEDVAPELGVATAATYSWCGAWQDYDGDGDVDLFVGRGLASGTEPTPMDTSAKPDALLANAPTDTREFTSFVDVSAAAGIDQDPAQIDFTVAATWGDVNNDGMPDLFQARLIDNLPVGPPGGPDHGSHLYVNQGDGTFAEESDLWIASNIVWNSSASWADVDNDADLDLIATAQADGYVGTRVYRNDQMTLDLISEDVGLGARGPIKSANVLDVDLDGFADVFSVTDGPTDTPMLYLRDAEAPAMSYYDAGSMLGLQPAATSGVTVEDWNGDGDPDLYLGRPDDAEFFYRTSAAGGGDQLSNEWVGVRLVGGGGNNVSAIGAQVVLKKDGVPTQVQVVDGGSGRGGQLSRDLVFGLADNASSPNLTAAITWPNGFQQTATLNANSMNVVNDATPATVIEASITITKSPYSPSKNTWTFEWETPYLTRIGNDRVTVSDQSCSNGSWVFQLGSPNVTCKVTKSAAGYHHEIRATNLDCTPRCQYEYTIESATDFQADQSDSPRTFYTKICVQ